MSFVLRESKHNQRRRANSVLPTLRVMNLLKSGMKGKEGVYLCAE